jgi:hypothetical protein
MNALILTIVFFNNELAWVFCLGVVLVTLAYLALLSFKPNVSKFRNVFISFAAILTFVLILAVIILYMHERFSQGIIGALIYWGTYSAISYAVYKAVRRVSEARRAALTLFVIALIIIITSANIYFAYQNLFYRPCSRVGGNVTPSARHVFFNISPFTCDHSKPVTGSKGPFPSKSKW